jgi:ankyrin repeat protein
MRALSPFAALVLSACSCSALAADANGTRLADAVQKQDRAAVQTLLPQCDATAVNAAQVDGMTALHWAAYLDDAEIVRALLKAGANAKAANRYEVAPLSLACANGNAEIVEMLLAAGADPNTTLRGGETALMSAARTGNAGAVKALLARGADVNAKERRGQTPIMWAAAEGNTEVVNLLIRAGADFTTALDSGFTPLFFAARDGRSETVRALLAAGADINSTIQPRRASAKGPRPGTSALLLAVENGHFELAIDLLKAGADPNDQRSGFTPLHALTWVRKPNRGEDDGDPAPFEAGHLSSLQFARKLISAGADVNAQLQNGKGAPGSFSKKGVTPFMMAAATADATFMRALVEWGADPSISNVDGCTPLIVAAGVGIGSAAANETAGTEPEVIEAAELLLQLGADVNAVDKNGETAMHGAAYKNLPKVVEFLAAHGATIDVWNRKNKYGWTPLKIAEGYRPGNFKPSFETIEAIQRVMRAAGVEPPASASAANAPGGKASAEKTYSGDAAPKPLP